jgi:hypothetical protein
LGSVARVSSARATISACVIAQDEEERLPACLDSLAFCDEVVVVDGGSRDATVALAERAGARVIHQTWLGFAAQRNVALDHARSDWVLEIDADERVTSDLALQLQRFLESPPQGVDIGGLPIRHRFLGGTLGPSAKYPDYRHRFFRRLAYRHDPERTVHEGIWPKGPVERFSGDLEHELASSVAEALRDARSYARGEAAQLRPPPGIVPYFTGMLARPTAKLLYRLIVGGGWRDGGRGVLHIALDSASDSLVWTRALSRRGRRGAIPHGGHFSAAGASERAGSARVVAVAKGKARSTHAAAWLDRLAAEGADVVLVTDANGPCPTRVTCLLRELGPFCMARTIEAEHQLRPIDVLVPAGPAEQLALCCVPRALRGITGVRVGADPRLLIEQVNDALRPSAGRTQDTA